MCMDTFADIVRVVLLVVAAVLAMLCIKVAWIATRDGSESARVWIPATVLLLLVIPAYLMLPDFGGPLSGPYALFAAALGCGVMSMRAMFTMHSDWVRFGTAKHAKHHDGAP